MAELPFLLQAEDVKDLVRKMQLLMDDLYHDKIAGADIGDVFTIGSDNVFTLTISSSGGLEKSSAALQVKKHATGGLASSASGLGILCKAGGGLSTDADGLFLSAAGGACFAIIACPAGTNPTAEIVGDTLTLTDGSGIDITGNATTDAVTIALDAAAQAAVTASHARSHSITSTSDHTSTATSGKMLKANANGLPVDATNTDTDVSSAVSLKHAAVTLSAAADFILALSGQEIGLDTQTANTVLSGPTSGAAAAPAFRSLVSDDIPIIPATKVELSEIGTATYDDLQDFTNVSMSSGYVSGGVITDNGAGGIAISQVEGFIKASDSAIGVTKFFTLAAGSILTGALTDNACNYIYVDYNAGTPAFASTTDRTTIKTTNQFPLGRIYKSGTDIEILQSGIQIQNYIRRNHERLVARGNMERMSGSLISATGTRQVYCTAGVWYVGSNRIDTAIFDSSSTNFDHYYYYTGAAWAEVTATGTIDNTQYNNVASGLATLTANRYGVHWVYQCYEGELSLVFGQGDYTLSQSQAAQPPASIPDYLSKFGVLIGKVVIQKSATSFTSIESAFSTLFIPEAVTTHNNLAGLQGGTTGEYYHLTSAQHGYLNDANAQLEALQTDRSPTFAGLTLSNLPKMPTVTDNDGGSLDSTYFGKMIVCTPGAAVTFNLPSVAAGDVGAPIGITKLAGYQLNIDAADSDTIEDSGAGDTIYSPASDAMSVIILQLVTATQWKIMYATGTWVTTD